jgi:hypothetical protein
LTLLNQRFRRARIDQRTAILKAAQWADCLNRDEFRNCVTQSVALRLPLRYEATDKKRERNSENLSFSLG